MRDNYKIDEETIKLTRLETLRRILAYFSSYKLRISLIIAIVVIMTSSISILPLFTQRAIDVNISGNDIKGLLITISIAFSLCLIWWCLSILKQHMLARITNDIVYRIRKETYDNVLALSIDYFDLHPSGRILARLVGDMDGLKTITQQLVNDFIPNTMLLILILAIMIYRNFMLAIASFIVIPLLSIFSYLIIFKGYSNWENYRKKESNYTAFVHESYSGIKTIQAFLAENETKNKERRLLDDINKSWSKAVKVGDSLNIAILSSQALGYALLFIIAVKVKASSIGEILAYIGYMGLFWQPIKSLASMYAQLINNLSSAARVFALMDEKPTLNEHKEAKEIIVDNGGIIFESVSFSYPDDKDRLILDKLSFSVDGGKRVALVGTTGVGKTTIINLIARFYDPTDGRVLIDNQDISRVTLKSLRENISVMPQDSFLFNATIKENLLYGREVCDDEMRNACIRIGIDSMIENLPNGYNTLVEASSLSQGQRQLIALARTLISSPKILILDEATSNIDTETELMVQKGLEVLLENRTVFVVAHRLSTIRNCDEIFFISDKGISERGTHQELMAMGGEYKVLYDSQFKIK